MYMIERDPCARPRDTSCEMGPVNDISFAHARHMKKVQDAYREFEARSCNGRERTVYNRGQQNHE
jgi:hypothetical protein